MANTLYVVFHGLVSLIEDLEHDNFHALLLDMPDHRMAAGHWLTEVSIRRGAKLVLPEIEVVKGTAKLDPTQYLVIETERVNPQTYQSRVFAEITLPRPDQILPFSTVNLSAKQLLGNLPDYTIGAIAESTVFVYQMSDAHVTLMDAAGNRVFRSVFAPSIRAYSLHILNEPEGEATDQHSIGEFNLSTELLNSNLQLTTPAITLPTVSVPPKGLDPAELLPLYLRRDSVFNRLHSIVENEGASNGKTCGGGNGIVQTHP